MYITGDIVDLQKPKEIQVFRDTWIHDASIGRHGLNFYFRKLLGEKVSYKRMDTLDNGNGKRTSTQRISALCGINEENPSEAGINRHTDG
jgi:hypothetical protein